STGMGSVRRGRRRCGCAAATVRPRLTRTAIRIIPTRNAPQRAVAVAVPPLAPAPAAPPVCHTALPQPLARRHDLAAWRPVLPGGAPLAGVAALRLEPGARDGPDDRRGPARGADADRRCGGRPLLRAARADAGGAPS